MKIYKAQENNVFVQVERGQVVGEMIVLAVNDKIENYIEVTIEEAKEKYNYQIIKEDDGNIER
jgi:hypothetical protein